jgi:eukaryotic-like serine/threonine-protein kinase
MSDDSANCSPAPDGRKEPFADSDELNAICERFESAWRRGERLDLDELLPRDSELRRHAIVELVNIELELRLKAGEAARCEEYFARFPEFAADQSMAVATVALEFHQRSRLEPKLAAADFVRRFPQFAPELEKRLTTPATPRRPRALRLNCPHCHNPIQIVDDFGDEELVCPSCGSAFNVRRDKMVSWSPERLPKLGRFELLEAVGRGAFGTVYRAKDTELDRIVAVKMPRSGSFITKEDEDRFVREGRSVAQLRHPGIVPVYEVGRSGVFPYLASEFVDGLTLADAISGRRFGFRESAEIIRQAAEALDHAHGLGVVHRDVKPSNLMIVLPKRGEVDGPAGRNSSIAARSVSDGRPELTIRVMDFGLARRDEGEITVTLDGQVLGTPAYMSPEQARGAAHGVSGRSDIYSLGAVLYQLLTGELPFRGNSQMLLHQVMNDEPRAPRSLNDRIPKDLETIALKCLQKDPNERYATAAALAADLRRFLDHESIQARPIGQLERGFRWCQRNRLVAILAASVLLTFAVGAAVSTLLAVQSSRRAVEAGNERDRANFSTAEAVQERDLASRNQYFALINLAQPAWDSGNVAQCLGVLKRLTPQPGEPDLRGFEYRYLHRLCHQSGLTLGGHTESVMSIAQSADGRKLLSGGADGKLLMWDPSVGKLVQTLSEKLDAGPGKGRDNEVRGIRAVALTPDGTIAASVTLDQIQIWDVNSGNRLRTIDKVPGDTFGLSFSPDGKLLAATVLKKIVLGPLHTVLPAILWYSVPKDEYDCFEPIPELALPGESISALAFSPDGSTLAIATGFAVGPQQVCFLDTKTKAELASKRLRGHRAAIVALAFSADGRLATGSADQTIQVWNLKHKTVAATLGGHRGFVTAVRFSADGKECFSGGADHTVREWDVAGSRLLTTYRGHADLVTSLLLSPGDAKLITASGDGTIRIWPRDLTPYRVLDLTSDRAKRELVDPVATLFTDTDAKPYLVSSISLAPDRSRLAAVVTGGGKGTIELRSLNGTKNDPPLADDENPGRTYACGALSPDGKCLAAGEGYFLDAFMQQAQGQPANKRESDVVMWNLQSRTVVSRMPGHKYEIFSLAFSSSGEMLATGDIGGAVNVWRMKDRQRNALLEGDGQPVVDVRFSHDGRFLAAALAFSGSVRIWEVESRHQVAELKSTFPTTVAFSPDGNHLAVGSGSSLADRARAHAEVSIWDWRNGRRMPVEFAGHTQFIRRVFYTADGTRLWSVGFDGVTRLWDPTTGNEFLKLEGDFRYGVSGDLRSDGNTIAVGTETGQAIIWTADK